MNEQMIAFVLIAAITWLIYTSLDSTFILQTYFLPHRVSVRIIWNTAQHSAYCGNSNTCWNKWLNLTSLAASHIGDVPYILCFFFSPTKLLILDLLFPFPTTVSLFGIFLPRPPHPCKLGMAYSRDNCTLHMYIAYMFMNYLAALFIYSHQW